VQYRLQYDSIVMLAVLTD